jgi:prophage maintenance system killer protein
MEISKKDLLRINLGFGGNLRNDSSLDYAITMQKNRKYGEYKKLAFLMRAILVDHPFTDGNKRTATFLLLNFADQNKKEVIKEIMLHQIISIAKHSITEIRNIENRLRTFIK